MRLSPVMVCLSWINIGVQVALPISLAFTPAMAARADKPTFLGADTSVSALATRPYVLGPHETVSSVANRYNLTPDALRKLNQFRTFAGGWETLRTGDELDVPVAPLPPVVWEGENKDTRGGSGAAASQDAGAHRVAGLASQAGGFLSSSARGDAAASMARGMATGAVGGEVQQWLSKFGTARVQLDADKNFSLKQSQLELLVPLHEKKGQLVFAQGSVHRTDERTQTNLGVGYRWFNDGWMLGGNTFLDHDLSQSHTRMGVGLEYWRDFLKLGANSYHRLSSWKDSPDLTDYEERPANGWDLRAQAWVPALPQLGGKLTFEQYYGDQVGLFGKDARQSNPHAITAGVNYTPIPLLTFNAEHRQGQAGKNDARLGVEMRYQLGVPWQHQVEPAAVAAMRSLAGSRHDLVERNNHIVLEYRKKEVIRLRTTELVTGHAGERKSLGVVVNSKYGLERIDWSAPTLLAAGGKIVNDGPQGYGVVLPPYRTAAGNVNSYTVSGVAVDTKGNASNRSETQVTVLAPVISERLSSFLPASSVLLADGKGTQVLTLTLKDGQGQAVDVTESEIAVGAGDAKRLPAGATISTPRRSASGTYEVTVTAGTRGEVVTLTPVVSGVTLQAARVNVNDMTPAAEQSSFTASPTTLPADNQASTTLTLTLKNAAGDALSGLASQLSLVMRGGGGTTRAAEVVTLGTLTESGQKGVYTATFKGTVAGKYALVPEYNGSVLGNLSASVTLTAGVAVQAVSHIAVDKASYASGGDIGLTVTLKDAAGNPVVGQEGVLSSAVTVEHAALRGAWSGTAAGEYTATYTAKEAGAGLKASLLLNGWRGAQTATYAITAGAVATDTSTIRIDKTSYASGESMAVTVMLKDTAGNPVPGQVALLPAAVSVAHAELNGSWSDKGEGSYGATYTAKAAGANLQATLTLNGASATPATYAINAGAVAAGNSTIAVDRQTYVSGSDMTVTVALKDAAGNPVSGQEGSLADKVAVPNAVVKSGMHWTEAPAGSGIYTGHYVAGTVSSHQTATLRLGGDARPSGTYAITAGAVTAATLTADKATYVSGSAIILTATLKDAQGNPVPGEASALTATSVTADNATAGTWSETTPPGTYRATYTAKTAGTGLKAELKLGGASATPVTYAITAGAVTAATLTADKATYVSGSAIILTATLKDAQGNPVPGEASALTATSVTADNATAGTWSETTPPGTYRATYTAKTAGTGLKAELKLGGASATPVTYAITAGAPVQAMSAIALSGTQYLLGSVMLVTVTLKDAQGNAVIGRAATLTAGAVTVANATLKDNWRDADNGSYVASYTATAVGTGLTATLQLADWSTSVTSEYIIYAAPRINSVNISGPGKVNLELEAQVKGFNSNGTGYDDSLYQWYYKSAAGAWLKPQGEAAKQQRWTPDNSYAGYTIKVGVTPKGKEKAILGEEVFSAEKVIYGAPDAKNVHLMNTVLVGSELKIEYSFIANGTGENTSQYRWYWHDDYASRWRLIDGVTSDRWRVPTSYAGYRVKVEVLPRGSRGDVGVIRPSNTSRVLGALPTPKITWSACWRGGLFWRDKELAFSWDVTNIPTDGITLVTDSGNNYPSSSGEFKRQRSSSNLIKVLFMDEYGYKSKSVMIHNEFSGAAGCNTVVAPGS